jgi:hypothetical protein
MPWEGADRRAVMRAHEETIAILRRDVRVLRAAVVTLTIIVAATIIGSLSTWIALQHQRQEARTVICSRMDETRKVFSDYLSAQLKEQLGKLTQKQKDKNKTAIDRANKLIVSLETPACTAPAPQRPQGADTVPDPASGSTSG